MALTITPIQHTDALTDLARRVSELAAAVGDYRYGARSFITDNAAQDASCALAGVAQSLESAAEHEAQFVAELDAIVARHMMRTRTGEVVAVPRPSCRAA